MRAIALDIGERRIGVAVSDPQMRVATPLTVLDARRVLGDGVPVRQILSDYDDVGLLVVGLPRSLDGSEGPQAASVRRAAERIAAFVNLPIEYVDERLSSAEASRRMAESGLDERARRGSVDMVAASLFLQAFLDNRDREQS